ncbi:hypothetical protein EI427_00825 [Flammeovirga pectinis]|uniref:Two component regulator three Y domain-containing protein n=1 Tax=Flammeovirga pectinis TaxID=2494373 RepID=A0A3Q9FMU4_9BACT|nr:two-component regulator propeller domain-containing protein [Flammeovirga pectinis]AZQ60804.1 hypothetical protein EI427_00825 [Flammeovirga pectinis]
MKQLTLFLLLISLKMYGQLPVFHTLSMKDGLPHNTINQFCQDDFGFIWVATDNGLSRYDAHSFKNYTKSTSKGLSNNQVLSLLYINEKEFWVGTASSLDLFNIEDDTFKQYPSKSPYSNYDVPIMRILTLSDSILIIGTNGGGVRGFNRHTKTFFSIVNQEIVKDVGIRIENLFLDKRGQLWIFSHEKGIVVLNPKMDKIVYEFSGYDKYEPFFAFSDAEDIGNNTLLISSYGDGLYKYDITTFQFSKVNYSATSKSTSSLIFDLEQSNGKVYIATDGQGIYTYDIATEKSTHWNKKVNQANVLANNVVRSLFIDKRQNLWAGHYQGGISSKKHTKGLESIPYNPTEKYSLSHSQVSALLNNNDELWIGTDGGKLNILSEGTIKVVDQLCNRDVPEKILSLYKDSRGWIWMGTYLEGVYVYQPKENKFINIEKDWGIELPDRDVRCFYEDIHQEMWIGTHGGGVLILDLKDKSIELLQSHDPNSNLSINFIRAITRDSYGLIWMGTSYGLNCYDPVQKRWRVYLPEDENSTLKNGYINAIHEDTKGRLWIGTGEGLYQYNRNKDSFSVLKKKEGLSSDIIVGVIEDNNQNLWITTDNGLSKVKKDGTIIRFDESDGLIENTFFHGAVAKSPTGEIYLGTVNGLVFFTPENINEQHEKIDVIFTGLKIFNEDISVGKLINDRVVLDKPLLMKEELKFFKKENVLTFSFSAVTYAYSEKVTFEYYLEGFNKYWITLPKGRSITFTNLDQGDYTLRVRVNNMGPSQPSKAIKFKILPPFYETTSFKIIIGVIVLFLFWLFWRLRYIKIKRENEFLEREVELERVKSEQDQIKLEKLQLESEVKEKKAELDLHNTKLMSNTLLMVNKNEMMNQVKSNINNFSDNIENAEVKKEVGGLLKIIDTGFKIEDDWEYFEQHFDQIHKDFFKRAKEKYPDLTLTYLKLMAYLKLELTTKEIATLLNISTRGVEKSRYRLRKKIGLNAGENFKDVLDDI